MAPADTLRARMPGGRLKGWLLLDADRWVVAALFLAIVFSTVAALVSIDPVPIEETASSSSAAISLFYAMITAIVTGVTLVVTINQVVLSQEFGAVGDQRERMEGSLSFRSDVAEHLEEPVSPAEPAAFLRAHLDATATRARRLREAAADVADPDVREAVVGYVDDLVENAETARDRLEGARFGSFDVVQAALGFNYSIKIHDGKRLQARYGADAPEGQRELSEDATAALAELVTLLELYGPAREHVKTLYFQWSLTDLSRAMLYASVPALAVAIGGLLTLNDAGTVGGSTLGTENYAWAVIAGGTVALTPFAILLSHVLRIATITKHTLAMGPFVLRATDSSGGKEG